MDFINNSKIYACYLYNCINNNSINNNYNIDIICDLFKIHKSTLYRWINEYNNIDLKIDTNCHFYFNFYSHLITKEIVIFVLRFFINNAYSKKSMKLLLKKLNKLFPNNKISYKHIHVIIEKNKNLILIHNQYKSNNIKITNEIEKFIIEQIKNNSSMVANDIKNLIFKKFNLNISLPTIYNIFKKNNYTYKRTKININPYSLEDQKQQLTNVYYHLKMNNDNTNHIKNEENNNIKKDNNNENEKNNNMDKDNNNIDKDNNNENDKNNKKDNNIENEKNNNIEKDNNNKNEENNNILLSIDEMSIITNRGPTHGWSLKNSICEINIPFFKPNVRYSLLMASSNIKIIKYKLVKGSIKSDDFINFIIELNKENPNYNFLIDNASIHKSKKANNIYKEKKINIIYNAPYQSEFNPIEMIFSLLRKKLNKKIVKNEESILEVIKELEKNIKKEELENIFRHCEKRLKEILKI